MNRKLSKKNQTQAEAVPEQSQQNVVVVNLQRHEKF